jgi:hypothetical protein
VRCEKYGGRSEDVVDGSAVARNSAPIKERHDQRLLPARLSYGKPNISVSLAMQVWFFNSLYCSFECTMILNSDCLLKFIFQPFNFLVSHFLCGSGCCDRREEASRCAPQF